MVKKHQHGSPLLDSSHSSYYRELVLSEADLNHQSRKSPLIARKGRSHPGKAFIGRIKGGFDFLGDHFVPDGLSVAKKTVENFVARAIRLYEQEPGEACASSRLGLYVRRWVRWVQAGLPEGRPPP